MSLIDEAVPTVDEAPSAAVLQQQLDRQEAEFSEQRATMKELYLQKEAKIRQLEDELADLKTAAKLKEEELDFVQQNYKQEVESLHHIIRESVREAVSDAQAKLAHESQLWQQERLEMRRQIDELQAAAAAASSSFASAAASTEEDDSFLHSISKSLSKSVSNNSKAAGHKGGPTAAHDEVEASNEDLEEAMVRAKRDVEVLKSIVAPYQEEVASLKSRLREAEERRDRDAAAWEQRRLVQQQQLELERRNTEALKLSLNRLNEQYLGQQRRLSSENRHLVGLLDDDQKQALADFRTRKSGGSAGAENSHADSDGAAASATTTSEHQSTQSSSHAVEDGALAASSPLRDAQPTDSKSAVLRRSVSGGQLCEASGAAAAAAPSTGLAETGTASADTRSLANLSICSGSVSGAGRIVSEQSKDKAAKVKKAAQLSNSSVAKEWSNLQLEIDKARRKASAGCELCRNYEAQLQTAQAAQRERAEEATRLSTALRAETARAAELSAGLADAEARAGEAAERWREQADEFARQTDELRACLDQLESQRLSEFRAEVRAELARLLEDRTALQSELQQLERWYNHLLESRDGRTAQQMRDELIDLPDNLDDAQVLALQLREDLITARANLEHVRQRGRDQLAFAKQQLEEEVAMRRQLQAQLQSESDRLKSVQSELQAAAASRHELEDRLQRQREEAAEAEAALRSAEVELKARLGRSECEAAELKNRAAFLQVELQNAMSVQKDFVELSQSLQVQLEGLRQQDTAEVRWQFPEDAAACHSCQRKFAASAKPRRCLHCVRLFCQACTDKTVPAGPCRRPANVCSVCHTMLVKDAAPYFSDKAPSLTQQ
ncbi:hypothetical protein BOX15_Mlig000099g1 [Macrostomum lignano]|uniref:FYVE-type domain-containing protein n=1 Tax=Macrostomum lignano TaxID=282301 RepID=A0A267F6H1_9PLAT|nr:hypothetical protein BOX15_Mlig000099g1 [Macrostomum lignano]